MICSIKNKSNIHTRFFQTNKKQDTTTKESKLTNRRINNLLKLFFRSNLKMLQFSLNLLLSLMIIVIIITDK